MSIRDSLLPEYDHEMANTRRMLARVPDAELAWRPHEKSFTLGELMSHLATIPHWGGMTLSTESFDVAPDGEPVKMEPYTTAAAAVEGFDRSVKAFREVLAEASDETLMVQWSLLKAGKPIFTLPRVAVLRGMIFNHSIHHRAQLGLYLRMLNVAVPSIYGPSADEESP